MKIKSYKKIERNLYQILFEDLRTAELYEETILKFDLLLKKEISSKEWVEIQKVNHTFSCYYEALKYLTHKNRFRKEIMEYLKKKHYEENVIELAIEKLEKQNFINEERFLNAYIHDQIYLSSNGPQKIKKNLLELGVEEDKIISSLQIYSKEVWKEKLEKIILKKMNNNRKDSILKLKEKIISYGIQLGYEKEDILSVLAMCTVEQNDTIVIQEANKLYIKLIRKYKDKDLFFQIKRKLFTKGFSCEEIENAIEEIKKHYYEE